MSKADRTKPGSKNDWRITYSTGSQKWTDDRPGDGKGESSGDMLRDALAEPAVQRGLDSIQHSIENDKMLDGAVNGLVRDIGVEKARTVLNAIHKSVKGQKNEEGWDRARKMVASPEFSPCPRYTCPVCGAVENVRCPGPRYDVERVCFLCEEGIPADHPDRLGESIRRSMSRKAGVKDVVNRIFRVFDVDKARELAERVVDFWKTKDQRSDLTPDEQRALYRPVDYGEVLPLTKKRKVDIGWTDHAEYRSDLRDVDPDKVNEAIRDRLREKLNPPQKKKVKMKEPGLGTMVVDFTTQKNPAKADVITVWGSDGRGVGASRLAASPASLLAKIVSTHWGGPWKVTFDDNLVNVMLKDPDPGGATVMEVGGQETMSGQRRRKMLRQMRDATRKIEMEAARKFDLEDSDSDEDSVFLVSNDFVGVPMKVLKSRSAGDFRREAEMVDYYLKRGRVADRAIPLDKAAIRNFARNLATDLKRKIRRIPDDESLGKMQVVKVPFVVRDVAGEDVDAVVVLRSIPSGSPYVVTGAGTGTLSSTGDIAIAIDLNGRYDAGFFRSMADDETSMLYKGLVTHLLHELTHVADKFRKRKKETTRTVKREDELDPVEYYNDPAEVKAFMQEVVDEVEEKFPLIRKQFGRSDAVQYALKMSRTWRDIRDHLSPRNKQKIMNAVVNAIGDLEARGAVSAAMGRVSLEMSGKPEPPKSKEQAEAGNYAKGHVRLHGLDIAIENAKGQYREGVSPAGKKWRTLMKHHYGYVKRTESDADGDHVDVFIGPDEESEVVFVVNQTDPETGEFDEHKCMLGFTNAEAARKGYLENYEKGWEGLGSMVALTVGQFKDWLADGDTSKPIDEGQMKTAMSDMTDRVAARHLGAAAVTTTAEPTGRDAVTVWLRTWSLNQHITEKEVSPRQMAGLAVEAPERPAIAERVAARAVGREGGLVSADEMERYCPQCAEKIRAGEMQVTRRELEEVLRDYEED